MLQVADAPRRPRRVRPCQPEAAVPVGPPRVHVPLFRARERVVLRGGDAGDAVPAEAGDRQRVDLRHEPLGALAGKVRVAEAAAVAPAPREQLPAPADCCAVVLGGRDGDDGRAAKHVEPGWRRPVLR